MRPVDYTGRNQELVNEGAAMALCIRNEASVVSGDRWNAPRAQNLLQLRLVLWELRPCAQFAQALVHGPIPVASPVFTAAQAPVGIGCGGL